MHIAQALFNFIKANHLPTHVGWIFFAIRSVGLQLTINVGCFFFSLHCLQKKIMNASYEMMPLRVNYEYVKVMVNSNNDNNDEKNSYQINNRLPIIFHHGNLYLKIVWCFSVALKLVLDIVFAPNSEKHFNDTLKMGLILTSSRRSPYINNKLLSN